MVMHLIPHWDWGLEILTGKPMVKQMVKPMLRGFDWEKLKVKPRGLH